MRAALAVLALAGCASFEDPTIVLDLRVLGIETSPPEQILDIDPDKPPTLEQVLLQLRPIRIRALVAEPDRTGDIEWEVRACILDDGTRCDPAYLSFEIARGTLLDPEDFTTGVACPGEFSEPGGTLCVDLFPDNVLVQMLLQALKEDVTGGLGGIDLGIELRVNGGHEAFAAKHVRFAPRIPKERKPNNNPRIEGLLLGRGGFGAEVRKQHCMDSESPDVVRTEESVTLFPTSAFGDQEEYVLPTLDGHSETFKEYLSYQWIATGGDFVDDITGGPPDVFGNIKLDGTEWKSPKTPGLVTIWVIQRDSRYGVRWRQTCIKVEAR